MNLAVKAVQAVEVVDLEIFEIVLVLEDERVARVRLNAFTMSGPNTKARTSCGLAVTGNRRDALSTTSQSVLSARLTLPASEQ
jgi:hypothetical protein